MSPASCCACIAGHPQFELAAVMSDSQPGESVAKALPASRERLPRHALSSRRRTSRSSSPRRRNRRFSARRPMASSAALIDTLLKRAERARNAAARRRYLGRLPLLSSAQAYEAVYKHPHGAPARLARIHLRGSGASEDSSTRRMWRIPAASPPRRCSRACRCWRSGSTSPTLFVSGVTGSTGSGRKPVEGHASPAAAQRPVHLQRALASACAGNRRLRARRIGSRGRIRVRAALGAVRARHPRHRAGAIDQACWTRRSVIGALRDFYAGAAVRACHGHARRG